MSKVLVIAFGGNALLKHGENGTIEEQYKNVLNTTSELAGLLDRGYRLVITHGNGPQVGIQSLRH